MSGHPARARRLILLAVAGGLALRLAFGLLYWIDKPLTHDEHEYLALARGIASGQGFVYDEAHESGTAQRFGRAPVYPLFLASLDAGRPVPSATPARVKIAQSLVGALTVGLVGLIAFYAAGPRAGVWAAGIAAVYPPLVSLPSYALSETLFSAVALAAAFVLQLAIDRAPVAQPAEGRHDPAPALAFLAGALAGAAALVRPAMLLYLPLAIGWLLVRRRPALAVAATLAATVVITPWTLRNLRVHDRFVLIASEGGVTFWTGNHPLAGGEGDLAANPRLKEAELAFRRAHPGLSPDELEPLYYREALGWIAAHPLDWTVLLLRKAFFSVVPAGPSYAVHSVRYRVASVAPYLLVLPFAAAGARRLWHSPRRPVSLLLLAASSILVGLVFFPQERFRMPVIDPVLIVSAAALAGGASGRPQS
jgi:4-amino-4-deoxy-L-arabinose transferase-like glycosyltransferase